MNHLENCSGPISGEHLISESVCKVLRRDGDFTIGGLPWIEVGETRKLEPRSLRANCLCAKHNSLLHPLDDAAAVFVSALRRSLEDEIAPSPYLVSGHDVERWLLKTLKALAESRNLASGRVKLPGSFASDVDVVKMLNDHLAWPLATGLYFVMPPGARMTNHTRFQIQPWYGDAKNELVGLWCNFVGLEFVMMIAAPDVARSPGLKSWLYRPSRIRINIGRSFRMVDLSWEDTANHENVNLTFEKSVKQ